MAEVWGRMALRLANAEAYPHDLAIYGDRVSGFIEAVAAQDLPRGELTDAIESARVAVSIWRSAADSLERAYVAILAERASPGRTRRLAAMNEILRGIEQHLLDERGIPGRPWFKHVLYAPRYTYAAMTLPGVQEAMDAQDWVRARVQLSLVAEKLRAVAAETASAASVSRAAR
jgi:N-acetylated-alpha-linked acidic dipeptidase